MSLNVAQLQAERTFEDYLAYLPPMEIATTQVVLVTLLGSVFHTKCECVTALPHRVLKGALDTGS